MTDAPRPEARAPRGFNDRRARDLAAERQILAKVSAVYERYGFEAPDYATVIIRGRSVRGQGKLQVQLEHVSGQSLFVS